MSGPAPGRSWPDLLGRLASGESLSTQDTAWAMDEIMGGDASAARLAAFAVLLRAKGETPQELAGLVQTMLERATPVEVAGPAVDIVGTGGDLAHTVNITTMAALVVAGSGRTVVKHGNRSASSLCGSADVLEELGVAIDLPAQHVAATVAEAGIGFCFAPVFHSGMRHAGPTRADLGIPTFFNFLGPLTNPARPAAQAIGVYDARMLPVVAGVFAERGVSALVFRGEDGLDELSTAAPSTVFVVRDGTATQSRFDPADLGIPRSRPEDLRGGDAEYNAGVVRDLVNGKTGPVRDAVLLNAAAALVAFDNARGAANDDLVTAMGAAYERAAEAVDSGRAAATLDRWIEASRSV